MKRFIVTGITAAVMATALALPLASPVFADTQPTTPTQSTQSTQPTTPTQSTQSTQSTTPGQPGTTHQPGTTAGVNCGTSTGPSSPGSASSSPGAPFNEPGINSTNGGTAGSVYAGSGVSGTTASSPAAVSQYDVACK